MSMHVITHLHGDLYQQGLHRQESRQRHASRRAAVHAWGGLPDADAYRLKRCAVNQSQSIHHLIQLSN